jgi:hypothetical protein
VNNILVSQCVCSGILAGTKKLQEWTGGDWACDRGNNEYVLVSGVADQLHTAMRDWFIWPETTADENFSYIETNYLDHVTDCDPGNISKRHRYDLGLLRSRKNISALLEIKRYWEPRFTDLTKLSRALLCLGAELQTSKNRPRTGVSLESVFFGAFVWHNPNDPDNYQLKARLTQIKAELNSWWQTAKTSDGQFIRQAFQTKYGSCLQPMITFDSKAGTGTKADWEMGAACVYLSLDETF